jgi:hypothetical protein
MSDSLQTAGSIHGKNAVAASRAAVCTGLLRFRDYLAGVAAVLLVCERNVKPLAGRFVQFYPTLLAIAKEEKTIKDGVKLP